MILQAFLIPAISFSQVWDDNFVGIDSLWNNYGGDAIVKVIYNYNDSILFIGGGIRCLNNDTINSILKWDTMHATGFDNGVSIGGVNSIIM